MYYYEKVNKKLYPTLESFAEKLYELSEEKAYRFVMKKHIIYTRERIIRFFDKWNGIGVGDEFVLSGFNRDFFNEEQKDLIKIINCNRDHCNIFLGAIPSFSNIDNQVRALTKLRLTVLRRGLALIQTPNKTIFSKDKWDYAVNEKIEKGWLEKKIKNPRYAKLTTVKGILRFPDLDAEYRKIYEDIKKEERNIIAKEKFGITDEEIILTPAQKMANQLIEKGIKNSAVLQGFAMANGIKQELFKDQVRRELLNMDRNPAISSYYWDEQERGRKKEAVELLEAIRTK
jgi:hypothetical protein